MHLNYYYFILNIFGAIIGSFLNVVILRYNTGQSIVFGQSKCFSCTKKLKWYELFPVASFVFLRGKCSLSKQKYLGSTHNRNNDGVVISVIFQTACRRRGFNFKSQILILVIIGLYFLFLIIIAVYDYRHQIIPNLFVWIFNGLGFLSLFGIWNFDFGIFDTERLACRFCVVRFFALLCQVSKGKWMGFPATPNWLWELVGFQECQGHSRRHSGLLGSERLSALLCFIQ